MTQLPAVSLAAVPGRRAATLEVAREIERRGFPGIYGPSLSDNLALCEAIALVTERVEIGTTITPIYTRNVNDFAQTAGFIHEVSGGRFRFGVGVSHEPAMKRIGVTQGKPLADMRPLRGGPARGAAGRRDATHRAGHPARPHDPAGGGDRPGHGVRQRRPFPHGAFPPTSFRKPRGTSDDFFIGNMIPTCISDDVEAAKAVNRRTLTGYAALPNYRNYWKEAGYEEEMAGRGGGAGQSGDMDPGGSELCRIKLAGGHHPVRPARRQVREGIEAWFDAGIRTPIIVPSSAVKGRPDAGPARIFRFVGLTW